VSADRGTFPTLTTFLLLFAFLELCLYKSCCISSWVILIVHVFLFALWWLRTTCLLVAIERQNSLTLRQEKSSLGHSCHSQSLVRKLIFYHTVKALLHQTHAIPSSMKVNGVILFVFLRFDCLCATSLKCYLEWNTLPLEQGEWGSSVLNSELQWRKHTFSLQVFGPYLLSLSLTCIYCQFICFRPRCSTIFFWFYPCRKTLDGCWLAQMIWKSKL